MGTPPPGDTGPGALCKALPAQRPHHPLGALGLVLLQEGPTGSGDRAGELIGWHILPSALSPRTAPPGDLACSGPRDVMPAQVPKARGEQSQQLFCLSFFLSCYVYFEFEYIGDLHCCGFFFLMCKATLFIYT